MFVCESLLLHIPCQIPDFDDLSLINVVCMLFIYIYMGPTVLTPIPNYFVRKVLLCKI